MTINSIFRQMMLQSYVLVQMTLKLMQEKLLELVYIPSHMNGTSKIIVCEIASDGSKLFNLLSDCNVLPMVWRVTNEPVDCRPSRGTNKHTQDRKRCSLLDDNSTATADYDSAHANYTVNYIRQLHNHDYIHMTTTTSYKFILRHVTI